MSLKRFTFLQVKDEQGQLLLDRVLLAKSFWLRFRGLMLKPELDHGEGMLFPKTNAIHCLFMKIPIDVIFLDRDGLVVKVIKGLKPWRTSPIVRSAAQVLECADGTAERFNIAVGQRLLIKPQGTREEAV